MVRLGLIGCGRIGEFGIHSAASQHPTSVRFSGATHTEPAAPYHHLFLDRYTRPTRQRRTTSSPRSRPARCRPTGSPAARVGLVLADAANESLRTGTTVKVVGA
jgi:myo-inositol 2-dehydrogenase/D-chiro-inositol 1-dehydrogenase